MENDCLLHAWKKQFIYRHVLNHTQKRKNDKIWKLAQLIPKTAQTITDIPFCDSYNDMKKQENGKKKHTCIITSTSKGSLSSQSVRGMNP